MWTDLLAFRLTVFPVVSLWLRDSMIDGRGVYFTENLQSPPLLSPFQRPFETAGLHRCCGRVTQRRQLFAVLVTRDTQEQLQVRRDAFCLRS